MSRGTVDIDLTEATINIQGPNIPCKQCLIYIDPGAKICFAINKSATDCGILLERTVDGPVFIHIPNLENLNELNFLNHGRKHVHVIWMDD